MSRLLERSASRSTCAGLAIRTVQMASAATSAATAIRPSNRHRWNRCDACSVLRSSSRLYTGMPSRGGRLRPRKIAMTATSTAATSTAATAAYGHSQWMLMSFVVISATFP